MLRAGKMQEVIIIIIVIIGPAVRLIKLTKFKFGKLEERESP